MRTRYTWGLQAPHDVVLDMMGFRLSTRKPGFATHVIEVEGELDLFRTPDLKELFLDLVREGGRGIVIDLARTTSVDSTALGLLMSLPRLVGHGVVVLACDNPQIRKAFEVTGADRRLAIEPDVEPALERVEQSLRAA
jgi:anti-sigma B factor antagonist